MKAEVVAMVLAGGRGSRLNIIASGRAKPAVPFGGNYRIMDFTLTNIMKSGIRYAGILTQYRPQSLMIHLGDGETWDLAGHNSSLKILPPVFKQHDSDWYGGTADAVFQNLDFIRRLDPEYVVILSGDHIYSMDYRDLIKRHQDTNADITIAAMEVPWEETSRFGTLTEDAEGRVTKFVEKSPEKISNIASMGVYVFNARTLLTELSALHDKGGLDFGKHVIPAMLEQDFRVFTSHFNGYWRDVGTLHSFWAANMDILKPESGLDLDKWAVRTNLTANGMVFRLPATFSKTASIGNSVISIGCKIEGSVINSVLFPGVNVAQGAVVRDSVIMHDCEINQDSMVERAILDKYVYVGSGALVGDSSVCAGTNHRFPDSIFGGLTVIGKDAFVPYNTRIGTNAIVGPGLSINDFRSLGVPDGECLGV